MARVPPLQIYCCKRSFMRLASGRAKNNPSILFVIAMLLLLLEWLHVERRKNIVIIEPCLLTIVNKPFLQLARGIPLCVFVC